MEFGEFSFGTIRVDGTTYDHDIIIDQGEVKKRRKKPSKKFREEFGGHTPLSLEEDIPWKGCSRLVIGTGAEGALPVMDEVKKEAQRRGVELVILPTSEAMLVLAAKRNEANGILHVTC